MFLHSRFFAWSKRLRSFQLWEMSPGEAIKRWLKDWQRLLLSSVSCCRLTCGLREKQLLISQNIRTPDRSNDRPSALHFTATPFCGSSLHRKNKKVLSNFTSRQLLLAPVTTWTHQIKTLVIKKCIIYSNLLYAFIMAGNVLTQC